MIAVIAAGCGADDTNTPQPSENTNTEWPEPPTFAQLDLTDKEALRQQSFSLDPPDFDTNGPNVLTKFYRGVAGPTGHGSLMGTTVYYVKDRDVFYFRSDCGQNHYDGFIGPFRGDPREILAGR